MHPRALLPALFCGGLLVGLPAPVLGQAAGARIEMAPAEAEAYQMGLEMTFVCNPQRHRSMAAEAVSSITRTGSPLTGTASYVRSAEGTFLVLEGYDEEMAGHCLVLAWFGGALEPGHYPIRRLAMDAMEEELDSREHSFFTLAAVRSPDESSVLVTDSGSVELSSVDDGTVAGSFDVRGFVVEGTTRTDDVTWQGSFTALAEQP